MKYPLVLTEPERPLRQPRVKDKGPGSMQLDTEGPLLSPPSLSTAHLHVASAQPGGQSPPGGQIPPGAQSPLGGHSPPSGQSPLGGQSPPNGQTPPGGQSPPGGQTL